MARNNASADELGESRVAAGTSSHEFGYTSIAVGPHSLDLGLHRVTGSLRRPATLVPVGE